MSNTRRKVQRGWGPGDPEFDRFNSARPEPKQVKSVKHQTRDRRGRGKQGGKHARFNNRLQNSRYNLQRKNEEGHYDAI